MRQGRIRVVPAGGMEGPISSMVPISSDYGGSCLQAGILCSCVPVGYLGALVCAAGMVRKFGSFTWFQYVQIKLMCASRVPWGTCSCVPVGHLVRCHVWCESFDHSHGFNMSRLSSCVPVGYLGALALVCQSGTSCVAMCACRAP